MSKQSEKAVSKIALVTGSSRGLGRNMVLHLARKGVDVVITYRSNKTEADAVAAEVRSSGARAAVLQLDVADSSSFAGFATRLRGVLQAEWGRDNFDYLVNNAGIGIYAAFAETSEAQFDELFRIHLKGPFFLTQNLLPLIADGGRILNVSSGLARFSMPGFAAYAAMKGGVEVLARYMAAELGSRGIAVNTLAPRRHRNRFRRRSGARHAGSQPAHRRANRARPGRPAGRYRRRSGGPAVERQRLDQRSAHRGGRRHLPLGAAGCGP